MRWNGFEEFMYWREMYSIEASSIRCHHAGLAPHLLVEVRRARPVVTKQKSPASARLGIGAASGS